MSNANLPRVDDLEKSPQWTILANEINGLEQLCRLNNHRHPRRQPLRYNYHRYSMPQMQKATSVWIEPSNELNEDFQGNNEFPKYHTGETYRWNWRPKTEFERTYFFYDYNQGNLQHDTQNHYTPPHCNKSLSQNVNTQESDEYQTCHSSLLRSDRSLNSFNEGSCAQIYNRIYDNEPAYSGTRERLHEIFERNRYLRRKFFSSTPDNDATDYIGDFPKELENKNPSSTLKYNGFGSTETITSQSNQSSLSSNDRKSRCQSNVTTLGAEEDICNSEFSHKTSYSKNSSVNVDHMQDGRIMSTTTNGKLLVNIKSENEVCQVNESTSLHNAVPMENFTQNNSLIPSQKFNSMDNSKYDLDHVKQRDTVSQYESNAWACYQHNLEHKNEGKYQNGERKINGSNEKIDQLSNSQTTKDILQQQQETNKTNKSEKYETLSKNQNKDVYISNLKEQEINTEPEDSKYSYRLQDNYKLVQNIVGSDLSISEINKSNGTPFDKDKTWMKDKFTSRATTNRWDSLQNLCMSLPNLSFYEKTSNSSDNNFTNNLAANLSLQCDSKSGTKSELSMNIPNEQGRQETTRLADISRHMSIYQILAENQRA
ncbi:LOW QUALITY PROTEIN: homeobox protein 4-like [Bombus pyrosoma]|uniref:LOW QUALITY PROTEIN: homeobox protein 4-like n=1 Tax=Bombus pyrosoma TaxID=396416 RepID=UPI001CB964BC|nr:LOW QUALITY PROTEIN: homeobox protein 4-like [Bombus pyrosoma]